MKLSQLEHFIALVELKNYSKASEACYVSRQAISKSVRSLSDELGLELVELDERNQPAITEVGIAVYHRAKTILDHINELQSFARDQSVNNTLLRIAVSDTLAPMLFPSCMNKLQELKREKELNIGEISQVANSLLADSPTDYYDLAIFLGNSAGYRDHNIKILKRFPVVLTIPYTSELYEKQPILLDDLTKQTVIVPVQIKDGFLKEVSDKYSIIFEPISNVYQAAHTSIAKAYCILDALFDSQDTDFNQREIQNFSYNWDVIAVWRNEQNANVQHIVKLL